MRRVLFAVTSHGLGHLTRTLAIARALRDRSPDIEPIVATTVPEARVARDLPPPFGYRPVSYEPGTHQRNVFELDVPATHAAYERFLAERPKRLRDEEAYLREAGIAGVVSDVPALPVRAAAAVGIPAIAVSNFTWDWILEPLCRGTALAHLPGLLAEDYARGTWHLRLPFGPDHSPFPRSEAAPLVSRRARLAPAAVRTRLGLPPEADGPLVLVCPGGWLADQWPPIHVPGCAGLRFVTAGDMPVTADAPLHALPRELPPGLTFPDLVAAAAVVLAKPGYGMASECAAHRTALVSIERHGFRETPFLVEGFRRLGPSAELGLADFFAGRWEAALRRALESDTPWAPQGDAPVERVADRLAELLAGAAPPGPDAQ